MDSFSAARIPVSVLTVATILGVLGFGRALLMLIAAWLAYRGGVAIAFQSYLPFLVQLGIGLLVIAISVGIVARVRLAWTAGVLVTIGMLCEEVIRAMRLANDPDGSATFGILGSAVYVAAMIAVIALLLQRTSRDYQRNTSAPV